MNESLTLIFVLPLMVGLVGYICVAAKQLYEAITAHDEEVEDELSELL